MSVEEIVGAAGRAAGFKQVLRGVREGKITRVVLALDTDGAMAAVLYRACKERGIKVLHIESKARLGSLCGLEVPCAAVGC